MNEDPKPPDFDTSDLPPLEEPELPSINEFDARDLEITPPEGRPVNQNLDHEALIEHGKAIARLEAHVKILEELIDNQHQELRALRKLMAVWVAGH